MSAVKYLASVVILVAVSKAVGASIDATVLGYCILTAGWIANKERL